MAFRRPKKFQSIVASAANLTNTPLTTQPRQTWQQDAWGYYDTSPELRYAMQYLSNAMSRVRLYAAKFENGKIVELPPDHPASVEFADFGGGPAGRAQLMSRSTVNIGVAGICYLIGEVHDDGFRDWSIFSGTDVKFTETNGVKVAEVRDSPSGASGSAEWRQLDESATITSIWRPHAQHIWDPDSPVRATLPALAELDLLNDRIAADAMSRLAGAGILVLPSEATFEKQKVFDENGEEIDVSDDDDFSVMLTHAMTIPISQRNSAAAVVPLVVRIPGEYADAMQHLQFSTPFDEHVMELRSQAISRVAIGIEVPNEVLTGMGDVNHWTAWQVDDSTIKMHVEPLAEVMCEAFTEGVYGDMASADGAFIWYSAAELRVRPDRSSSAVALWDRNQISDEAFRRETGFTHADKPDRDEVATRLLLKTAEKFPNLLPDILKIIAKGSVDTDGIELDDPTRKNGRPTDDATIPDTDTPGPASGDESKVKAAALLAAADGLVVRALERASNKLARKQNARVAGQSPHLVYMRLDPPAPEAMPDLFAGAWNRADEIAREYGVDSYLLQQELHTYCVDLLANGTGHSKTLLADKVKFDGRH